MWHFCSGWMCSSIWRAGLGGYWPDQGRSQGRFSAICSLADAPSPSHLPHQTCCIGTERPRCNGTKHPGVHGDGGWGDRGLEHDPVLGFSRRLLLRASPQHVQPAQPLCKPGRALPCAVSPPGRPCIAKRTLLLLVSIHRELALPLIVQRNALHCIFWELWFHPDALQFTLFLPWLRHRLWHFRENQQINLINIYVLICYLI